MADDMYLLIIEGYGDSTGLAAFATAEPAAGLKTNLGIFSVHKVLDPKAFEIQAQKMRPRQLIGSEVSYGFDVAFLEGTVHTGTNHLLKRLVTDTYTANNSPVRLTEYVGTLDPETAEVTDSLPFQSGLPKHVWLGTGEVVEVTSEASGSITFNRAQLGSRAIPHPHQYPGRILFQSQPAIEGWRVRLYLGTTSTTQVDDLTLVHSGIVDDVGHNQHRTIGIRVRSRYAALAKKSFKPPVGSDFMGIGFSVGARGPGVISHSAFRVFTDLYGDVAWDHAMFVSVDKDNDDVWAVFALGAPTTETVVDDETGATRTAHLYAPQDIHPVAQGIGERPMDMTAWLEQLELDPQRPRVACRVQQWKVWTGTPEAPVQLSDVLTTLLGGADTHWRMALNMTADEFDSDSLKLIDVAAGASLTTRFTLPLVDGLILDIIKNILQVVFCGLGTGSDGRWRAVDWGESSVTRTDLDIDDVESVAYEIETSSKTALDSVDLDPEAEGPKDLVLSEIATQLISQGQTAELKLGWFATIPGFQDLAANRARQMTSTYAFGPPRYRRQLNASAPTVEVGDTIRVTDDNVVASDGTTGIANATGVVYARSTQVSGAQQIEALMTGLVRRGELAVWGPSAQVNGQQPAGTTTIPVDANCFTDPSSTPASDAESFKDFTPDMRYILVDDLGTRQDTNAPAVSGVGVNAVILQNAFADGGGDIIVEDGWFIIPANYTLQPAATKATDNGWVAATDGTIGTDVGRSYL